MMTSSRLTPAPNRSARAHRPPMERAASSSTVDVPCRVDAQLGVHGPSSKPQRGRRSRHRGFHRGQHGRGLARRRDVDGLLEIGPVHRVGLVEHGQHLEIAPLEQAFDRHLGTGYVALDEEGLRAVPDDGPDPGLGRLGLGGIVDPDDPLAGRPGDGLHHARIADVGGRGGDVGTGRRRRVGGLGDGRQRPGVPASRLVPGAGDGIGRTVTQAQLLGGQGGDHTPWSSTARTASSGVRACRATMARTAAAGRPRGTTMARSPMAPVRAWRCSDPTTTSTPRRPAAARKSDAR